MTPDDSTAIVRALEAMRAERVAGTEIDDVVVDRLLAHLVAATHARIARRGTRRYLYREEGTS